MLMRREETVSFCATATRLWSICRLTHACPSAQMNRHNEWYISFITERTHFPAGASRLGANFNAVAARLVLATSCPLPKTPQRFQDWCIPLVRVVRAFGPAFKGERKIAEAMNCEGVANAGLKARTIRATATLESL